MSESLDWNILKRCGGKFILTNASQRAIAASVAAAKKQIVAPMITRELLAAVPWPARKHAYSHTLRRDDVARLIGLVSTMLPLNWRCELEIVLGASDNVKRPGIQLCEVWFNIHPPEHCCLPSYGFSGECDGYQVLTNGRNSGGDLTEIDDSPFASITEAMEGVRADVFDHLKGWVLSPATPQQLAKG